MNTKSSTLHITSMLLCGVLVVLAPVNSFAWLICNRSAYAKGEQQVEFDLLSGNEARHFLSARSEFNLALVTLENAIEQELAQDTERAVREYKQAIEHVTNSVSFLEQTIRAHDEMVAYIGKFGPEPDFITALKAVDYDAMYDRLSGDGLVHADSASWENVVSASRTDGVIGLIGITKPSIKTALTHARDLQGILRENVGIVQEGRLLVSLETGELPAFAKANQTGRLLAQAEEDCAASSMIAKEVRGTAGWTTAEGSQD